MRVNERLPACVYVPFLKSIFVFNERIFEVLQYSQHPAQLVEDIFHQTKSSILHLS